MTLAVSKRYLISVAVLVAALAAGCKKAGRSIVQVNVTAETSVTGLTDVVITVSQGASDVASRTIAWTTGGLRVGLFLSDGVTGDASVAAVGRTGTTAIAWAAAKTVKVSPGENSPEISLVLSPTAPTNNDDAGMDSGHDGGADVPETGGTGTGGAGAGGNGTGGTGTGGSGTGGVGTGGTGGAAGGGGRGTGGAAGGATVVRTWSVAEMVENDRTDYDHFPKVAMNAAGNGVIGWQRGSAVWARTYNGTGRTWGTATMVAPVAALGNVQAGIDSQGNAMVVWSRDDSTTDQGIWWSRTTNNGTSWSVPKRIAAGKAFVPTLAVGPDGTALAAWTENVGSNLMTVVSCDFRGGDWNATLNTPKPGPDANDRNPRVSVDGTGRGFLIWEQPAAAGEVSSVWTERYDGTWAASSVATLESDTVNQAYSPSIALNETGAGTATWLRQTTNTIDLWARRYDGANWRDPEMIATGSSIEWDPIPEVAIDPAGTSVVIWSQALPTNYNVRAVRHVSGAATWEAPQSLETNNQVGPVVGDYAGPLVGMDRDGNAIAVWRKKTTAARVVVYTSRLAATATTWAPVNGTALHDDGTHSAFATDFAVSRNGTALAAWYYGTEFDIWASVYR